MVPTAGGRFLALEVERDLLAREVGLEVADPGLGERHRDLPHLHARDDGDGAVDVEGAVDRLGHVVEHILARFAERHFALHHRESVLEQVDGDDLPLGRRLVRGPGRGGEEEDGESEGDRS